MGAKCGGPWGSLIVLAPKPHQENVTEIADFIWRMCVSYRALNRITKPFQFPIPRCDDSIYLLGSGIQIQNWLIFLSSWSNLGPQGNLWGYLCILLAPSLHFTDVNHQYWCLPVPLLCGSPGHPKGSHCPQHDHLPPDETCKTGQISNLEEMGAPSNLKNIAEKRTKN